MARAIELGLNRAEMADIPDSPETQRERPNYSEIGAERLSRAKERVVGFKDTIKKGLFGFLKRAAAAPEMVKDVASRIDVKGQELHQQAGEFKDSVVDSFQDKFIKSGEFVGRKYEAVSNAAVTGYRGLETRGVGAYNKLSEKVRVAKEAMSRKLADLEFASADQNLREAQARWNQANEARNAARAA